METQENVDFEQYRDHYDEDGFREKLKKFARKAGRKVVETSLQLYFTLKRKETPAWARTVVAGALGYFILPSDLVPDPFPVAGFTDDLGVLLAALATVGAYIDDNVKEQAAEKVDKWFGKDEK